jgi:hypothetical protein
MRRLVLLSVLLAGAASSGSPQQIRPPVAGGGVVGSTVGPPQIYGEPEQVPLDRLSTHLADLERRCVRTRGLLDKTKDGWYRLVDSVDAVLLIPVNDLDPRDVDRLVGMPVEIVGVAREIPERQGTCLHAMQIVPDSVCLDWNLPALPDHAGHLDWPRNSVTFWSVSDARPLDRRPGAGSGLDLSDVVHQPDRFKGKTVTVVGQFRGANLFGDLEAATRQDASDWVIADGGAAIWVTGKAPRGSGWGLSPDSRSDGRWWVAVTGEVQRRGGAVYIRAKSLALVKPTTPE